jgi:hypothetical protein
VPKQWTFDHHEVLRALLSFYYVFSIFLCCLLFVGDEFRFVFFMEWVAINIDQRGMCVVFGWDV